MGKRKVEEVLDFISEPKNYEGKEEVSDRGAGGRALRSTFNVDVKKRAVEYLRKGKEKLASLPEEFLTSFFYGVSEGVRDGSFKKEGWGDLIELGQKMVRRKQNEEGYRSCFCAMLSSLRGGFSGRENKIEFHEERVKGFWETIEPLIRFRVGDMSRFGEERDPMQLWCSIVAGGALELSVLLSTGCKRNLEGFFEGYLRERTRRSYEYVLREIRQPGVNCVFGVEFAKLHSTDRKWVEENVGKIFGEELWEETWGTYVSWGRPSRDGFKLLVDKGKYGQAVEKIGQEWTFKFPKEPDEGLVEHLMIGYFNGWIGFEDKVLKRFFEKASAELRGKAAKFMTTGFKSVNEEGGEEKEKVAARMKEYWVKRLAALKQGGEKNRDEAIELTGWVEDSLLGARETLELLDESLDLSGGRIGRMRDARDLVSGVSRLGEGNELLALGCLKKAGADENMHWHSAAIQGPLVVFLERMVEGPLEVRAEAAGVADLYGRYNPAKFRAVWQKLQR
jgi:hypothetical protein